VGTGGGPQTVRILRDRSRDGRRPLFLRLRMDIGLDGKAHLRVPEAARELADVHMGRRERRRMGVAEGMDPDRRQTRAGPVPVRPAGEIPRAQGRPWAVCQTRPWS
jgi:hypothetical protein